LLFWKNVRPRYPRKQNKTTATSNIQKKTLLHPSPWLRSTSAISLLISNWSAANGSNATELPRRFTRYSLPQCVHARYSVRGISVNRVPHAGEALRTASTSIILLYRAVHFQLANWVDISTSSRRVACANHASDT